MARIRGGENAGIYRFCINRGADHLPMFYIGHAAILRKRRDKHLSELRRGIHKNAPLQRAFKKYGEEAFTFEILVICPREREILELYERRILEGYPADRVYNICRECVGSKLGVRLSDEVKAKIGAGNRGKARSYAHRAAVAAANRMRAVSKETRGKMSLARMGNKYALGHIQTPEHRLKSTRHFIGTKKPPEEIARRLATRRANRIAQGLDIY